MAVAAEHAHALGLKLDAMFRLAVLGAVPPMRDEGKGFVSRHPQFRQTTRDGPPIEKASYAFPEVRELMVAIVREAVETFDVDGASLGFVRGPEFMGYEQPVLDDFRKEYGEDGRNVGFDDPRMRTLRCRYLNALVRDVRTTLDEVGRKKGRKLELSAWIFAGFPHNNLNRGMDPEYWITQGWLDSVISQNSFIDPKMVALAKQHKCQFIYNPMGGGELPKLWVEGYKAGVDGFAIWDSDSPVQSTPALWHMLRRAGHRQEIEAAAQAGPPAPTVVRLKTVGGFDVLQGLGAVAYSGG